MTAVQEFTQDATITQLLEVIAGVRAGTYVGVTVVVTDTDGRVEMKTLSIPVPGSVRSDELPVSCVRLAQGQ